MNFETFTAKFNKMRKEQKFVIYPIDMTIAKENRTITIQSDKTIGEFNVNTFEGRIYHGSSPYFMQLSLQSKPFIFPVEVAQKALACANYKVD
jgi:hypothetical protein